MLLHELIPFIFNPPNKSPSYHTLSMYVCLRSPHRIAHTFTSKQLFHIMKGGNNKKWREKLRSWNGISFFFCVQSHSTIYAHKRLRFCSRKKNCARSFVVERMLLWNHMFIRRPPDNTEMSNKVSRASTGGGWRDEKKIMGQTKWLFSFFFFYSVRLANMNGTIISGRAYNIIPLRIEY